MHILELIFWIVALIYLMRISARTQRLEMRLYELQEQMNSLMIDEQDDMVEIEA